MNTILSALHTVYVNLGPFFILLGILIFVHELGHFWVAKFFGVRVEVFSLGFGKKILQYKRGDTTYCLSMIPLGGYVKMYGDDPNADVPQIERRYAFLHKPVAQRFAIVLAGPLMNLFFAILVFSAIGMIGEEVAGPFVGDVATDSKAYESGLRSGDKIVKVGDTPTATWSQIDKIIQGSGGQNVSLEVERGATEGATGPVQLEVPVGMGDNENIFSSNRQVGTINGLTNESRSPFIGVRDPKSPAAVAGMQSLTLITAVNGQKISYWRDLDQLIRTTTPEDGKTVQFTYRAPDQPDTPENTKTADVALPTAWKTVPQLAESLGLEPAELYIYQVKEKSPAGVAGLKAKDRLLRIGGEEILAWNDVLNRVKAFDTASDGLDFTVLRDGQELNFKIKPEMTTLMTAKAQEEKRFTIGIVSGLLPAGPSPVFYRLNGPVAVVQHGLKETAFWTEFVVMSLVRLVQGEVSARNIGGVITIGRVAAHSFEAGMSAFLKMMGLISINLFLLNLLPIPILDGGHLVFYTIEALRGAPLSMRKMEIAQQVGLMLLMFLMAFAFFNDISNIWTNRM